MAVRVSSHHGRAAKAGHARHKRVARIIRDDNLIAATREWRRGRRGHMEVHVNLAGRMKVTGINQLWVADITYVRLNWEFVYLAVVLDRFSRRVVGWALDRTLSSRLPLAALANALQDRKPGPGLVPHSDRGVQYLHCQLCGDATEIQHYRERQPACQPGRQRQTVKASLERSSGKRLEPTQYANVEDLRTKFPGSSTTTTIERGSILRSDIAHRQNLRRWPYPKVRLAFRVS